MSKIEIVTNSLKEKIFNLSKLDTINSNITCIRDLSSYKSILFLLRNSDFAKKYLEHQFCEYKLNKDNDMFLFTIILAFIDIGDFKLSARLSKEFVIRNDLYWTGTLAKSHLLYVSLYGGDAAVNG